MATKKSKAPVKSKKKSTADELHKPSKMKPLKGKKKDWDDDDEEGIIEDDLSGLDNFNDDDDDDDY
jgi:hypothetical protein